MASLTIRNLDDDVKQRLRLRAARAGRSMEEEARAILGRATREAPDGPDPGADLGASVHARFAALGGADLPAVPRGAMRPVPEFGEAETPDA